MRIIFLVISLIAISLTANCFWSILRFIDGEEEDEDNLVLVGHGMKKEYVKENDRIVLDRVEPYKQLCVFQFLHVISTKAMKNEQIFWFWL